MTWLAQLEARALEARAELAKLAEHERRAIGQRFRWHLYRLSARRSQRFAD